MITPMYILLAVTVILAIRQWLTLNSESVRKIHLVQIKSAETSVQRERALDDAADSLSWPIAALNWIAGSAAYIGLVCTLLELLLSMRSLGQSNPAALLSAAIGALEATLIGLVCAVVASASHAILSRKLAHFGKSLERA